MKQNIYDNENFFKAYNDMRKQEINANSLLEIPVIKNMLPALEGKKILDLGCGSGTLAEYAILCGASEVHGIDISQNMISLAQTKNLPNSTFQVLPMEDLLTIDKKFDVVVSSLAFHYIKDFDKLISDISGLLLPGGTLVFSQEHPIATALIHGTVDPKLDTDGRTFYVVGDYNRNGERKVKWNDENVVKYHRNFETTINTLVKNNFCITEILEPRPSEETLSLQPKFENQFDRPYYLFVKATKQ